MPVFQGTRAYRERRKATTDDSMASASHGWSSVSRERRKKNRHPFGEKKKRGKAGAGKNECQSCQEKKSPCRGCSRRAHKKGRRFEQKGTQVKGARETRRDLKSRRGGRRNQEPHREAWTSSLELGGKEDDWHPEPRGKRMADTQG